MKSDERLSARLHRGLQLIVLYSLIFVSIIVVSLYFTINDYFHVFDNYLDEAIDRYIEQWKREGQ